jgi:hypothetical protein
MVECYREDVETSRRYNVSDAHARPRSAKLSACFFGKSGAKPRQPQGVPQKPLQPANSDVADVPADQARVAFRSLATELVAG